MWIPQNVVNHVIGKDKLSQDFEVVECLPCQDFSIKMVDCLISVGSKQHLSSPLKPFLKNLQLHEHSKHLVSYSWKILKGKIRQISVFCGTDYQRCSRLAKFLVWVEY